MLEEDDRTAHRIALDHIEQLILSGAFPVGARLPPERELAQVLGVSRGAVREAIRVLQAQGILESHPGPGRGTRIISGHTKALGRLFRLHVALTSTSATDLTDARVALERSTAALAARHWDDATITRLGFLVDRMEGETTLDSFNSLDTEFHVEIAVTARNPFIGDLTSAIREALRAPIRDASMAMTDWQELRITLCRQHRAVFEAIEKRDGDSAAALMETHIRTAFRALRLGI
jgi:transcriptional regulator